MIKALLFDVIGTVVDWRGTIIKELTALGKVGDLEGFADYWARYYAAEGFKSKKQLHDKGLELLYEYGFLEAMDYDEAENFSSLWTNLKPYEDSTEGLNKLRQKNYALATLTNLSLEVITELSNNVQLSWDLILSTETIGVKKPDPKTYEFAAKSLNLKNEEILMVASHLFDVRAAKQLGFKTAYVQRREDKDAAGKDEFDFIDNNLIDLYERLSCVINH